MHFHIIRLDLRNVLERKDRYCYPHFRDEKTELQEHHCLMKVTWLIMTLLRLSPIHHAHFLNLPLQEY